MGIGYYAKAAVKAVTTPQMRDGIKKALFQFYAKSLSRGEHRLDRSLPFGVNLIGHIRGDFGLGESCRLVAAALQASEIPFTICNVPLDGPAKETDLEWAQWESGELKYSVNLIHLNPTILPNVVWRLDRKKLQARYNIAFWLWELPEFPREWLYTFPMFDEIWTPAQFITDTLKNYTDKPVYTMPYGLRTPRTDPSVGRDYFGLPRDQFLFLISYDGNSVSARKNPEGGVRAYGMAFSPEDRDVGLVLKATHESEEGLRRMRAILEGYPNLYVLTDSYSREVFNSLIASVDGYISLHRAEGFGLVMAEAMLLGTPTVATNWSANTEFMDQDVACMVDAEVVELDRDYPPYHRHDHWAQPDEAQAARFLRRLYEDRAYAAALAQRAKARLEQENTPQKAAERIKKRLQELRLG